MPINSMGHQLPNLNEQLVKENYSDWEFLLNGNLQELRGLSEGLGTGYLNIYGGIDHWHDCPNDDFRMTTMYAQDEADADAIWQMGYELLSIYNGASELFQMNAQKLSIHELLHKDVAVAYVAPRNVNALLNPPPEIFTGTNRRGIQARY